MTELLLIRHGETAWNALRKLQGHLDIGLNQTGLMQAQALAKALASTSVDAIISSDLQRARQTADAIASTTKLPVQIDNSLRERCFGAFQGKLYSEIEALYPNDYAIWQSRNPDFHFPADENGISGESIREFQQRCSSTILKYARQYQGKIIAIVAHGGVLECAYRAARQLPLNAPREITIFNASINRFQYDGQNLQLLHWGDIRHLENHSMDEIPG